MIALGHKDAPTMTPSDERAMTDGLILFAHGSRQPGWAEPFEQLTARVRLRAPEAQVRLAVLELMQPNLTSAAAQLVAAGGKMIYLGASFPGEGGHPWRVVPLVMENLGGAFPGGE